jgi:hypothetical protein
MCVGVFDTEIHDPLARGDFRLHGANDRRADPAALDCGAQLDPAQGDARPAPAVDDHVVALDAQSSDRFTFQLDDVQRVGAVD